MQIEIGSMLPRHCEAWRSISMFSRGAAFFQPPLLSPSYELSNMFDQDEIPAGLFRAGEEYLRAGCSGPQSFRFWVFRFG
jgi:hypothetical protein